MDQTSSSSTITAECEGSEPSHPPLVPVNLCDSFIEVGSKLQSSNPELFANAISQLWAQFSLAVAKNPQVLCSSVPAIGKKAAQEKRGECLIDGRKVHMKQESKEDETCEPQKRSGYRKYMLPGSANEQEYYQCMVCKEKRHENSFSSSHIHLGQKAKIRWFCPLCNEFFAVTHRSGHIKKRHIHEVKQEECSPNPGFYCGSSTTADEAIERRVTMIASAAAAAVVSAAARSSYPLPKQDMPVFLPVKVEEEEEEEEGQCCSPTEKRMCLCQDDQATVYSNCSSNTWLPMSPSASAEDPVESFLAEDALPSLSMRNSSSLCSLPCVSNIGQSGDFFLPDIPPM